MQGFAYLSSEALQHEEGWYMVLWHDGSGLLY